MNNELFNELVASLHEGGKILHGECEPARIFTVEVADVKEIRINFKLT